MGEVNSTLIGTRGDCDAVRQVFDSLPTEKPVISMDQKLQQLLAIKYQVTPDEDLEAFETTPGASQLRQCYNQMYQEMNTEYNRTRARRDTCTEPDLSLVPLIKHIYNTDALEAAPISYYTRLRKLYMSSGPHPVARLGSNQFELLMRRLTFVNRYVRYDNVLSKVGKLALKVMDDCSECGIKLTPRELFRMLRLATTPSKLEELYGQFLQGSVDSSFFDEFITATFASQVVRDMIDHDISPSRLTDSLLLRHAWLTRDHYLALETIEHLLCNYHLELDSVRWITRVLLQIDETEFAHHVLANYFDHAAGTPPPTMAYRQSVQMIDQLLEPAANKGWLYQVGLDRDIVGQFEKVLKPAKVKTAPARLQVTSHEPAHLPIYSR